MIQRLSRNGVSVKGWLCQTLTVQSKFRFAAKGELVFVCLELSTSRTVDCPLWVAAPWSWSYLVILDFATQVQKPSGALTGPCRCLLLRALRLRLVLVAPFSSTTEPNSDLKRNGCVLCVGTLWVLWGGFEMLGSSAFSTKLLLFGSELQFYVRRELSLWPKNAAGPDPLFWFDFRLLHESDLVLTSSPL